MLEQHWTPPHRVFFVGYDPEHLEQIAILSRHGMTFHLVPSLLLLNQLSENLILILHQYFFGFQIWRLFGQAVHKVLCVLHIFIHFINFLLGFLRQMLQIFLN